MTVQTLKIGKREFVLLSKRDFERLAAQARRQSEQDRQDAADAAESRRRRKEPGGTALAKKFDCVAMKRAAQRSIRAHVRGLTPKQEIAFFRAGGAEFEAALAAARQAAESDAAAPAAARGARRARRRTAT